METNNLEYNAVGTGLFERVNELLRLDEKTGKLYWKVSRGNRKIGNEAGCLNHYGCRQISIDGTLYLSHKIVYLLTHGYTPKYGLDHINGVKDDNRPENLRETSQACNLRNAKQRLAGTASA